MSARKPTTAKVRNLKSKALSATQAKSVKGGIGMLLPAVQAARESARRT